MNDAESKRAEINERASFAPVRGQMKLEVGALVQQGKAVYRIAQLLDLTTLVGMEVESGRASVLRIRELTPLQSASETQPNTDLEDVADEGWRIAQQRFASIAPLIHQPFMTAQQVETRAQEVGVNAATLYRWIGRYRESGVVTGLIPFKRGWKEGRGRIPVPTEAVIAEVIKNYYLNQQRPGVEKTVREVQRLCLERGITAPSPTAIRARIARVPERERLRSRGFAEQARHKFTPAAGKFPGADFPLSVVQIDHTPLDIIVVDDEHRQPIGRPYVTLATDVYSRVITGYYLSLDAPSATSVAMAVAHSILSKEEWLILHDVKAEWPVWGIPKTIHVDNGAEFRSGTFQRACTQYGIHLEYRPLMRPQFGGNVERVIGTTLREIHDLPGTTFSSVKERAGYDSEKQSALTLSELERWLVTWLCTVYLRRKHASIGTDPLTKWQLGLLGNAEVAGIGIPALPADRMTLLLDFLPSYARTVQTFGVSIEGWTYYDSALRPWINAKDQDTGRGRKFTFRRDPRDISSVWFFDPELRSYFKIPFSDIRTPSLSAWEDAQIKERLKREGTTQPTTDDLLRALSGLREQVDAAKSRTKKARRQAQRQKVHRQGVTPAEPLATTASALLVPSTSPAAAPLLVGDIQPFGEIE
ncbi:MULTISPECIES: DDE-type integrase/transposase/recombinase [unclassified Deinococcus]|uniref:Mu transposase C-terminal domain-containing protein n=1 Tax=unclassified Deinococcus TaxID=2623546 RepID=UPI001E34D4FF|nr:MULTISPECIES: DDE-type integrase/transposase/recombinase [unclassified Deinococcus]MCD0164798.1 DDE-type integrase/transposase/recombinase [Deinococcus sp. 12RED42]MCD0168880.1 DDE-type integrase/transposase/recombinase [Deinococcus sp. 23YEL01]MCD0174422.1 DDE-type integrase/transposase/recombinase [Deinococcus sp. 14RED07]